MKQTITAFPFTLEVVSSQISFLALSLSTFYHKKRKKLATMEWLKHEFHLQIYSFSFSLFSLPFSQGYICNGSLTHC